MRAWATIIFELSKVRITFAVALTTIAGYLLAGSSFDIGLILPTLGIFILACGSSSLNHFQDRDKDPLMERTAARPIPSGRITANAVLAIAFSQVVTGSFLLYLGAGLAGLQLGLLALIWYNAIYTPLKRKTAFAVIPGSVIGALPPLVGWVAAGGSLADPRAGILAFFFFIWQVPHFWLLMLKYGKEYEAAGYPSITEKFSLQHIKNTTFLWTFATAISALMIPVFGLVNSIIMSIGILIAVVWLIWEFSKLLRSRQEYFNPFYYFMRINYFVLVIIVVLSIDPFL